MVVCKRSCSASRPPAKKLKLTHPETRSESFWNSLASTPLTKGALQEQTRRLGSVEPNFHYLDDFMLSPELPDECSRKLRKFSMHGGPDMRDVVGYCCYIEVEEDEEEDLYDPATTVSEVDEDGPYDAAFAQHLVDHGVVPKGVFPHGFVDPTGSKSPSQPDNLSELHKVSCRRRASLAGSDPGYDEFVKTDDLVNDGMETPEALLPLLEGSSNQCETIGGGVPFSNLDHLTDGSLVAAQPGTYHGVLQNTFRPRVLAKLRQQIVPSLDRWDPVLPTVFLEAKSPNACEKASVCQMLYTMALGARAYRSLQDAAGGRGPVRIDHGAYTFGAVYRCGWLQLFACYVRERNKKGWCVPVLLGEWDIRANSQSFCDGMAAYRNVRDWAAAKRVELVQQANDCC